MTTRMLLAREDAKNTPAAERTPAQWALIHLKQAYTDALVSGDATFYNALLAVAGQGN